MTMKETLKKNAAKAKQAVTGNWKRTLLFSAAFLAVGGIGVAAGANLSSGHHEHGDRMERNYEAEFESFSDDDADDDTTYSTSSMTYDEWKTAINDSSLSSADKKTFLAALEKAKDNITKVSDLQTQLDSLYTDNLKSLEDDYNTLMSKHSDLWSEVGIESDHESLSELDLDDITDMKQAVNSSSLSDADKSTLLSDLDSLKTLKEKYSTAYASYVEKVADLQKQLETAENAVQTSLKDNSVTSDMIAEVFGESGSHDFSNQSDDEESNNSDNDSADNI